MPSPEAVRESDMAGAVLPQGGLVTHLTLRDGTRLRTARWLPEVAARGTVLICTGRTEFIEKYAEVVGELLRRHFAVVVFDWRGQGLSTRALPNRRKGHVDDFRQFAADLDAVIADVLKPTCPAPFYGLAHSMGGTVMIHHASRPACAFKRIVLSAPMVEVHNLPFPSHLRRVVTTLRRVGLGRAFLPDRRRTDVFEHAFEGNPLTSDRARFARMLAAVSAEPRLSIGAPTIGWLDAAFRAMRPFASVEYCRAITVPILVVVPGADRVISVPAMERFAYRLKAGSMVRIAQARHEVLMERDALRDQFWAAFDAFIPGEDGASRPLDPVKEQDTASTD